ncbi:hypothetical protein N7495_007381 [Penicillium taxi]|uniref:uncharacterized protein n=1 Tax=Penicillium taxi TaxID=168475 RepID=UPI0025455819|nr:uncharacterized protein N7495_007381 [Penicillium taxi]KAJ5895690.1 hypothetical protein N7495_007381 [Penicillium taxi]
MSSKTLTKVTIVGATGRIGSAIASALLQTGKQTVSALTREGSQGNVLDGVQANVVDYDDEASVIKALKGQDFLIIALAVSAPQDLHQRICAAAGKAGVQYIMPNCWGYPFKDGEIHEYTNYDKMVTDRINDTKNGVSSSITLSCGFWYEWSLAIGEQWFGFTIKDRKVTFFDDGKRIVTVSTWDQCGRALAALLSLPESGTTPSVVDFKNGNVLIYSFRISQRDILDSLHRIMGTTDSDWEIKYEPVSQRLKDGAEELASGIFTGLPKVLYGGIFSSENPMSDYAGNMSLANDVLSLPQEDLDEATKRAVEMVENGWNPFNI